MLYFSSIIVTGIVCGLLLTGLVFEVMPAHILMFLAVVALMLTGVITPEQAFSGFSNKEMLTVAILYVVVAGFHSSGLTGMLADMTLGSSGKPRWALARLMIIVAIVSTFFNNTPIVAILVPAILTWCQKNKMAPSKLLLPLSYAAIFGGMCSLIGTSTNLVISGLMERAQIGGMSFFEIGYVGLPAALLGIVYMLTIGWRFLPQQKSPMDDKNIQDSNDTISISEKTPDKLVAKAMPAWKRAAPLFILFSMVTSVVIGYTSMFYAAAAAVFVTLLSGLVKPNEALKHVEWTVLIVIACSFGVATALEKSGLASVIGQFVVGHLGVYGPVAALFATLVAACLITELLTNNAAAALMFPLAVAIAQNLGSDPRPFAMAVAIGASAGFAMPFGYQTHLMVYGPGGYRFRDFLTVGIPLDLLYIVAGTLIIPLVWKL